MCQYFYNYNWSAIVNAIDAQSDTIDAIYEDFVKIIKWHVDQIVSLHKVTMRDSEPLPNAANNAYITGKK